MPFKTTIRDLETPLALRPRALGGFERADVPDPNSDIETFRRRLGGQPIGAQTSTQFAQPNAFNPTITAEGGSALGQNIALQERALAHARQFDFDEGQRNKIANIGVARDPRFEALKQALFEAGDPSGSSGPRFGFVNTREVPLNPMQAQRMRLLQAMDVNEGRF